MIKNIPIHSDSLIGKEIFVLEPTSEYIKGSGVLDNIVWSISCPGGTSIKKGEKAVIIGIDNNILMVTNK